MVRKKKDKLEEMVKAYNEEHSDHGGKAFLQKHEKQTININLQSGTKKPNCSEDIPLVLAIGTTSMACGHIMIRQARELVYCDSTASLDRYNCPTFIMSTSTSGGCISLGVVITSGESENTLTESFYHLRSVFPQTAFFRRGMKGPQMLITDDCEA